MTRSIREVAEGPQEQGSNEQVAWDITLTTDWGTTPTDISVVAYDEDGDDVSATVLSGLPSAPDSTTIRTPYVLNLTEGEQYKIDVVYTNADGQTLNPFFVIICK